MVVAEDFFRNPPSETTFFDEGPRTLAAKPNSTLGQYRNTGSISTTLIDGYRQGVEMTQMKHFDAGLVKIHAGEPGHVLRKNRFGMDRNFRNDPVFEELDYFSAVTFLRAQEAASPLVLDVITFPIITGDNDQIENFIFDGIIEPLTIRAEASFFGIETPFYAHSVKGGVMGGNLDQTWSSDQVLSIDYFEPDKKQVPFLDLVEMISISGSLSLATRGYFNNIKSTRRPFDDSRYPRNTTLSTTYVSEMDAALSLMSGSSDNYVSFKQRAAPCGWTFDNTPAGIDSIAFGGQTY